MFSVVTSKAPHTKMDIPQCQCLKVFGYKRNFRRNIPRCVKCTRNHLTCDCTENREIMTCNA